MKTPQYIKKAILFSIPFFVLLVNFGCTGGSKSNKQDDTLRIPIITDAKTFDPIYVEDVYSAYVTSLVYEGLLEYHYLKRPHELIPGLAESMPEISQDGLTYTFKIRKGVNFTDHPAFEGGKGREVKARDFVYSFLRVADPKNNAGNFWIFDGHIKGLNEWREVQKKLPATNYDAGPEGFVAVDDYTLQIKLTRKYPQLLFVLAMPIAFVVPREVVEASKDDFVNKPVGTGPYKLVSWLKNSKITFEKNPGFRGQAYPSDGEAGDKEAGLLNDAGKMMPFASRVEYLVFVEDSTAWLTLKSGGVDVGGIPKDNYKEAIDPATQDLTTDFKNKGMFLRKAVEPDVTYIAFNLLDPIFKKGGANLRKAISLAMDNKKNIEEFYNNRAIQAHSPVPPGLAGYEEDFKNPYTEFNIEKAKEYLAKAGFPEGKGLPELVYESTQGATSRQRAEKMQRELSKIGVKMRVNVNQFAELSQKLNKNKAQIWGIAWLADYPDAENFLQLLYGKNKSPGPNAANFDHPEYNQLYEQVRGMVDSPERRKLIRRMKEIFVEELPWIVETHRIAYQVNMPWTFNSKPGYMGSSPAKFIRVDPERRSKGLK